MKAKISVVQLAFYHFLFWALYVLSEYLANLVHLSPGTQFEFLRSTLLSLPVLMLPTYFLVWFAVPRLLKKRKIALFALSVLVVGLFVFYSRIKWLELINYINHDHYFQVPASKVVKNVIRDYAIIALAVCIYIIGDWRKNQQLNEALIKAKAEAEIKLLKSQLQPHFLFNSLNNIYSLALMKSDLTADSILKLTDLLEYLVYKANQEKIPLAQEVQLIKNYIGLEQLRYGEQLQVEEQINIDNEQLLIAPLLLLPFAENCFKHGGSSKNGIFRIVLHLKVAQNRLEFYLENSKKKMPSPEKTGGIGLENIQKRLQLIYPQSHQLNILDEEDSFKIQLSINLLAKSPKALNKKPSTTPPQKSPVNLKPET